MEGAGENGGKIQRRSRKSSICIRKFKKTNKIIKLKLSKQIFKKELFWMKMKGYITEYI
jgi:hypothetical protein